MFERQKKIHLYKYLFHPTVYISEKISLQVMVNKFYNLLSLFF